MNEPIFTPERNDKAFHFGDICEFHCEVESNTDLFQQLVDETTRQTVDAFDILEKAADVCTGSHEADCRKCPLAGVSNDNSCEIWLRKNIKTLIENQKRLYLQMTKDRIGSNDAG